MDCNPLDFDSGQQLDVGETLVHLLDEMRSLREKFEKSDSENKKLMLELKEELKTVRRLVQRYAEPEFKILPTNMPFDHMDDLRKFDEMLPVNDELRVELNIFLQRLSGKDFTSFLRTALRALVTDELAVNLTWRGTAEKPSVQSFNVFVILRDICHTKYHNANHIEINRICQQHFLHAKDRVNKKLRTNGPAPMAISPVMVKYDSSPPSSPPPVKRRALTPPPPLRTSLILPVLPLKTLQALEEFDEKLQQDVKSKIALKKHINHIDGKDYAAFLRAAFRALITDTVAIELTWRGTKEKPSIQDFTIFLIIRETCRRKFDEVAIADINKVCQQHFLHAKDRISKKAKHF